LEHCNLGHLNLFRISCFEHFCSCFSRHCVPSTSLRTCFARDIPTFACGLAVPALRGEYSFTANSASPEFFTSPPLSINRHVRSPHRSLLPSRDNISPQEFFTA
jgi:hypothetical protein